MTGPLPCPYPYPCPTGEKPGNAVHDASDLQGLSAAFAEPVSGAQASFRVALQALSHPGRVFTLPTRATCGVPTGLSFAMTALVLSLADADTPVWLPADIHPLVQRFFRFHCACPFVLKPADARFLVVPAGFTAPRLQDCHPGEPAYPDRSATLLLEVASLQGETSKHLRGPGIQTMQRVNAAGLPDDFWQQWHRQQVLFPLGVDVFLTCGADLCGLPRTTLAED